MKNNIKSLREHAGLTQAQLARLTGVGVSQVSKWEGGNVDIPTSRVKEIALALHTTPDELFSFSFVYPPQIGREDVAAPPAAKPIQDTERPVTNATVVALEGPSFTRMNANFPIYGTALGAPRQIEGEAIEQVTLNRAEVLEYVKRPILLDGNAAAYGLRVEGYSMEPRHRDGEIIIIDPNDRVRIGDDVVVYLRPDNAEEDDGETARAVLVKRIVRRSSGFVELEQYQPAKTFRIEMDQVLRIDRVVPWQELLS